MNCELAHERIVLAAYGELPDDALHELERHVATCTTCGQDREHVQAMKLLADAYPVEEVPANLVARSRLRLEEALDALPPARWFERLLQKVRNNAASLQAAPVAASLLILIGAGAGILAGYHYAEIRAAGAEVTAQAVRGTDARRTTANVRPASDVLTAEPQHALGTVEIANISSIVQQSQNGEVEVRFNQIVPRKVHGSMDDPSIRELLMLASQNATSPRVRDDSVDLLASACRAGRDCPAAGVREALMVALRYDRNSHVREKALEGLQPYVSQDMRVRDAVLEALLNDNDPQIRTAAINLLVPVEADTSVRQALQSVAASDDSPQIRLVSRQVLSRAPEIQ